MYTYMYISIYTYIDLWICICTYNYVYVSDFKKQRKNSDERGYIILVRWNTLSIIDLEKLGVIIVVVRHKKNRTCTVTIRENIGVPICWPGFGHVALHTCIYKQAERGRERQHTQTHTHTLTHTHTQTRKRMHALTQTCTRAQTKTHVSSGLD